MGNKSPNRITRDINGIGHAQDIALKLLRILIFLRSRYTARVTVGNFGVELYYMTDIN